MKRAHESLCSGSPTARQIGAWVVTAGSLLLSAHNLVATWGYAIAVPGHLPEDYPVTETCPAPGDNASTCGSCQGMPGWWVSEPAMRIWLRDQPLAYQPSRGAPVAFQLFFKNELDEQRVAHEPSLSDELGDRSVFSVGRNWFTAWKRYLRRTYPENATNNTFYLFTGTGGYVCFPDARGSDWRSYRGGLNASLGDWSGTVNYPSGAQDVFGLRAQTGEAVRFFLTEHRDPQGTITRYYYQTNITSRQIGTNWLIYTTVLLTNVTDADGLVTRFWYTNINDYDLIRRVEDPHGRVATLIYDSPTWFFQPNLVGITDAENLSSTINYLGGGALTNVVTPYGTNTFAACSTNGAKAVWVNEQGVRRHVYLYQETTDASKVATSVGNQKPDTSPFDNTLNPDTANRWDSYYWGPRQFGLLPTNFVSQPTTGTNLDVSSLQDTNYLQARTRHWLLQGTGESSEPYLLGQTLAWQQEHSPDGTSRGQITFYDYSGKLLVDLEGGTILPQLVGWLLPDYYSRYVRYERNDQRNPTNIVETWSDVNGWSLLRTNTLVYDSNNLDVVAITNADNVLVASNRFNAYHQVTTNWNALGELTVYTYNTNHQLTGVQLPAGRTVTLEYTSNWLSRAYDAYATNTFGWSRGLLAWRQDALGLAVTNTWDSLNRLRRVTFPDGTFITNRYDRLDLVQRLDRMGFSNRWVYNSFHQPVQVIDALNRTNALQYCDCGALEVATDALGNHTWYEYDLAGRLTKVTGADNYWVARELDAMGRVSSVSDSAGVSLTLTHNNQGQVTAVSHGNDSLWSAAFDVLDRATNVVNANGVTITNTFDWLGRLLTRGYPDGGVEGFGYTLNVAGATSYTNQLGKITRRGYDSANRLRSETNANNEILSFTYNPVGELLTLTDGKNQTTTWGYDTFGRATNKVDAAGNTVFRYAYDLDGRLTNRWTPAQGGLNTAFGYDPLGNLTNVAYAGVSRLAFAYDALNRLTNAVDGLGATRFAYNAIGQLLSEDGPWSGDTVSYSYTSRARTGLSLEQPNLAAWVQSYAYDELRRLTNVTSPAGAFGYTYDTTHRLLVSRLDLPNGARIDNQYDDLGRLTSTVLGDSQSTSLDSQAYLYNLAGQRTTLTRLDGSYVNYGYDAIGQLTQAQGQEQNNDPRLHEQFGYAYDAAWNLQYRTNNALVQTFAVNNLNELTSATRSGTLTVAGTAGRSGSGITVNVSGTGLSSGAAEVYADGTWARAGATLANGQNTYTATAQDSYGRTAQDTVSVNLPATVNYAYDANGNLTNDNLRVFEYDGENQLTNVFVAGAWRSDFQYDAFGRRRVRREYTWSGSWVATNEVRYVYDGLLVIQERHFTPQISTTVPQQRVTYTRGKDLSGGLQGAGGIGGLLARTETATSGVGPPASAYYHSDAGGNVTCLTDSHGAVVAQYLYDPYGRLLAQSGPLAAANLYRFSSKEFHPNSGLCSYGFRFYDPALQRWINRDPIAERGGINLHGFVKNGPLDLVDPHGLDRLSPSVIEEVSNAVASWWEEAWVPRKSQVVGPDIPGGGLWEAHQAYASAVQSAPGFVPFIGPAYLNATGQTTDEETFRSILFDAAFVSLALPGVRAASMRAPAFLENGAANGSRCIFRATTPDAIIDQATYAAVETVSRYETKIEYRSGFMSKNGNVGYANVTGNMIYLYEGADLTTLLEEARHIQYAADTGILGQYPESLWERDSWRRRMESDWETYMKTIGMKLKSE